VHVCVGVGWGGGGQMDGCNGGYGVWFKAARPFASSPYGRPGHGPFNDCILNRFSIEHDIPNKTVQHLHFSHAHSIRSPVLPLLFVS
jgi:hypothetical protein